MVRKLTVPRSNRLLEPSSSSARVPETPIEARETDDQPRMPPEPSRKNHSPLAPKRVVETWRPLTNEERHAWKPCRLNSRRCVGHWFTDLALGNSWHGRQLETTKSLYHCSGSTTTCQVRCVSSQETYVIPTSGERKMLQRLVQSCRWTFSTGNIPRLRFTRKGLR